MFISIGLYVAGLAFFNFQFFWWNPARGFLRSMQKKNKSPQLTIFFDGLCGLCDFEIKHLMRLDTEAAIAFEDINSEDFEARFKSLNKETANAVLHGQLASGELIRGLDVTCLAWKIVGKGRWVTWLRWPVFKTASDWAYRLFARNRSWISQVILNQRTSCETDMGTSEKATD